MKVKKLLRHTYYRLPRLLGSWFILPCRNVVLELTYRCNLDCAMCYLSHEERVSGADRTDRRELNTAKVHSVLDSLPRGSGITLTGGEVFLRKDFSTILAHATRRHVVTIATNGLLLSKKNSQLLKHSGVASVGISIDGPENVHDAVRGIPGCFRRISENVQALLRSREAATPRVTINTVIMPENVDYLADVLRAAQQWGVDSCTFQIYDASVRRSGLCLRENFGLGESLLGDVPKIEQNRLARALEELQLQAQQGAVTMRFVPGLDSGQLLEYYAGKFDLSQWRCDQPWATMRISPYGDVFPCLNVHIGNVRDKSLQALWASDRYRRFRRAFRGAAGLPPACVGCCKMERIAGD